MIKSQIFKIYVDHFHKVKRKSIKLNQKMPKTNLNLDNYLNKSGACSWEYNNEFYIFGGCYTDNNSDLKISNSLWKYNHKSNIWSKLKYSNAPKARTSSSAAIDIKNGIAYISFGSEIPFGTLCSDIFTLDIKIGVWNKFYIKNNNLIGRYGHTSTYHKGDLYIFGGTYGRDFINELIKIDLINNTMSFIELSGDIITPRYKHTMTYYKDDLYMIYGGLGNLTFDQDRIYLLNIVSGKCIYLNNLTHLSGIINLRSFHTTVSNKTGIFWIVGGADKTLVIYIYPNQIIYKLTIEESNDFLVPYNIYCDHVLLFGSIPDNIYCDHVLLFGSIPDNIYFHCAEIIENGILIHGGKLSIKNRIHTDNTYYISLN